MVEIKEHVLVFDIETFTPKGRVDAEVDEFRILGAYSFRYKKYFELTDLKEIQALIKNHDFIVGHNSSNEGTAYDVPVLRRHGVDFSYKRLLDTMTIMSKRAATMGYKLKRKSLGFIAEMMGLDVKKGDLDFKILRKTPDMWTDEEKKQVSEYLYSDVMITKQIFERVYDYYEVFKQFLSDYDQSRLVWVNSSLANVGYLAMCHKLGLQPLYSDEFRKEEIGGIVYDPKDEVYRDLWYIDVASLYPSIIIMFNMFSNPTITPNETNWFYGNDVFQIMGRYGKSKLNPMSVEFAKMFMQRKPLKKTNPKLAFAYKILMNSSGYGVLRSPIFKSTFYEHTGADVCRIGQKINMLMKEFFEKENFDTIYGDTDSIFIKDTKNRSKGEQRAIVEKQIKEIVAYVKQHVPFKFKGFGIDVETGDMVDYLCFFYDENTRKFKKKNYVMIHSDGKGGKEVEIKGLPIKKDNASLLGMHIYEKYFRKKILEQGHCKFKRSAIKAYIKRELEADIGLAAVTMNVKPAASYKSSSQLQAQVSEAYFDGEGGRIALIKNNRVGRVGKASMYCSVQEAVDKRLRYDQLILDKVWNELEPFIEQPPRIDLLKYM